MKKKNILVTGAAGFIGYHIINELVNDKTISYVIGLDNINNYYNKKLKNIRLKKLKKSKKFIFKKIDLESNSLKKIFNKKIDCVIHLAAQAGVRYSHENPESYINSNIRGTENLMKNVYKFKIKKFIFGSSSSVYGDKAPFPKKENTKTNPINIYSKSKKMNEDLLKLYSEFSDIKIICLRFFTVYGEWGRPDMLIMKYLNSIFKKKDFFLYNYGNHYRDFTYIKDVVSIIKKIIFKKHKKNFEIFNICSSKPKKITQVLKIVSKKVGYPKIIYKSKHGADVLKTFGDNKKIKNFIQYKNFTSINLGILKTIEWYQKNYKKFE